MSGFIIGIDSGKEGAIAVMDVDGEVLAIEDIPVDKIAHGKGSTFRVNPCKLWKILGAMERGTTVFIERPQAFPQRYRNKQTGMSKVRHPGGQGMLTLGENFGAIIGQCVAAGGAVTEIAPAAWKQAMSLTFDKNDVRKQAAIKFPAWAAYFSKVKWDGRAEACYIALYGKQKLFGR